MLSKLVFTNFLGEPVLNVNLGAALLQNTESLNNSQRHPVSVPRNIEILDGSLGLGSPVLITRNLNGTEGIPLLSKLGEGVDGQAIQLVSQDHYSLGG